MWIKVNIAVLIDHYRGTIRQKLIEHPVKGRYPVIVSRIRNTAMGIHPCVAPTGRFSNNRRIYLVGSIHKCRLGLVRGQHAIVKHVAMQTISEP